MKIKPQQSLIVVEPIPNEDTKLIIPTVKDENRDTDEPNEALRLRVIEVGPGRLMQDGSVVPLPINVGDEVLCNFKYAMKMLPESWYGGGHKWVVDYAGVLAVIERDPGEKVSRFVAPTPPAQPAPSQLVVPAHVAAQLQKQKLPH